jgi:hypothetical protein
MQRASRQRGEPRRLRHLDDGFGPVFTGSNGKRRDDGSPDRAGNRRRSQREAGGDGSIDRALAAIGNGSRVHDDRRVDRTDACREMFGDLGCAQ